MIERVGRAARALLGPLAGPAPGPLPDPRFQQGEHALTLAGVEKRFGAVQVLAGVSLRVRRGELVTVLGPSGCGKTTLLRIVAGFETADAGEVLIGERPVLDLPANRRPVNTVFQSYALFPHLSVARNVAFGLEARGLPRDEVVRRVARGLELLQLGSLADRAPHQLSGGQRQRVALARALVNEPELLLLDEPMSALDAKLRAEVQVELRRLQRSLGKTFVLVTHDQDEALTVSDRIVVMHQGRIEQEGPAREVYERPRSRFVAEFLGAANLLPAEAAGPRRARAGASELELEEDLPAAQGTLSIHPERVRVAGAAPASNGLRARVLDSVYRGDHVELRCQPLAPGPELRVQGDPTLRAAPGEELWLELPREALRVLRD